MSTIIKMFLNFGYVDLVLAGQENADYLYSIADSLKGNAALGVYTLREWMVAIYNGTKEPSRNEFDMDYTAFIHEMKTSGKIDAKEEARLMHDLDGKLRFEIESIVPVVNRVTSGRITTFCPLFSDNNVQKHLDIALITPEQFRGTLGSLLTVDFSAFYRETTYTNPELGIQREVINIEVMPEIILMPNIGSRSIMWQEIEGMKRATPARMFMPMFLQVDMKNLVIRLMAEFRWEMCKRVQGPRWNDFTEPSLTAEYYDYLQFYKNNRDLSVEMKTSIKTELTSARNNYKSVFVHNYTDWVLYESNGSARLNKIARRILCSYAPFPMEMRQKLAQNPQYAEALKLFNIKYQKRVQSIARIIDKISKSGKKVPVELSGELEFAKK